MSASERIRGVQVYRPIIYGSHARLLSEKEKESAPAGHTHRWTVFLTSATSPPPDAPTSSTDAPPEIDMDYLPGGADDLSYLVKKVTFRLHETYTNPARVFDKPPFRVTETGWGEFTVTIRVQFVPESGEKPMTLSHPIKLHHWGPPVEAPPVPPPPPPGAETEPSESTAPTPTPAPSVSVATPVPSIAVVEPMKEETTAAAVKVEGEDVDMESAPAVSTPSQTPAPAAADPSTSIPAATPAATESEIPAAPIAAHTTPMSIAARYPVHSWQYDELVFSDPSTAFLNLMNEHPPTPLPPKNRRARDQREEHDARKGKKGKKAAGPTAVTAPGLQGHMRADTGASTTSSVAGGELATGNTGTGTGLSAIIVGIFGEPGSADVPLEFSQEMEKGEWNRLNEARIRIVEEMDNWRERLIAQEKELAKVKEEMKAMS